MSVRISVPRNAIERIGDTEVARYHRNFAALEDALVRHYASTRHLQWVRVFSRPAMSNLYRLLGYPTYNAVEYLESWYVGLTRDNKYVAAMKASAVCVCGAHCSGCMARIVFLDFAGEGRIKTETTENRA